MDFALQIWAGGLYLLNKVFFSLAEGKAEAPKRQLRIMGWSVYILGAPAWVAILLNNHDWIAAAIEAGGVPAMVLGLHNALRNSVHTHRGLDRFASSCTYGALIFGVGFSLHDYGGLTSGSQLLEIGVMIGFLLGSYLLAKKNCYGWIFFMLMNCSMATLMLIQNKPMLTLQQLVSLGFVVYGFRSAMRNLNTERDSATHGPQSPGNQ